MSGRLIGRFSLAWVALFAATTSASGVWATEPDYPLQPVPLERVRLTSGLWADRLETNRRVTVWHDFKMCERTGRIDNFAVAGGLKKGRFVGIYFNDSDVYKVIEGASYVLATQPDPKLDRYLDQLIAKIAAAQEPDGYLYTARTIGGVGGIGPERWSRLAHNHELYNVGHLYEAAVAHYRATGKRTLLDVALKNADLICRVFGPDGRKDVPGHQEIELGLVKLYRVTGDKKYLRQAKFFLDQRGRPDGHKLYGAYCQDHLPVTEQREAVGHAVRACYMYAAMTDVAALLGDPAYRKAVDRLWQNVVGRKLYLTGAVGASRKGEAFSQDYALPNNAYNETCAAIANALWNHRMFLLHGDAQYVDVLERVLYNGFLAGVSLTGDRFFYPNPLVCDGHTRFNQGTLGRAPWFGCACCPVNVVRFVPQIPAFAYAVRDGELYVCLFAAGEATVELGGRKVTVRQRTDYPWDGRVQIELQLSEPSWVALNVRVPGWARGRPVPSDLYRYVDAQTRGWRLRVNGQPYDAPLQAGFARIHRVWKPGDTVELDLPMPVRRVQAHPAVEADRGRVALERGPLVYCFEAVDNDGEVRDLVLDETATFQCEHRPDLLGGVTVIHVAAQRVVRTDEGKKKLVPFRATAIPYYAWAHRQIGPMLVWAARRPDVAQPVPPPTLASRSRVSGSHCWRRDTLEALNDRVEPKNSNDHSIPRMTWWDHRGTSEWVQYDFPEPTTVRAVEVYWFDDTGRGFCRVPAAWQVLYRQEGHWLPVKAHGTYPVQKDRYNRVEFDPVRTDALRLQVELQPGFSGGILEWRVEPAHGGNQKGER